MRPVRRCVAVRERASERRSSERGSGERASERRAVTIGSKRHHPARGRVSAGWRPRSGLNNAVPSMAEAWSSTAGAGLGPAHRQEAGAECRCAACEPLCARARELPVEVARALHGKVTSDGGWASWPQQVTIECGEGKQKEGEKIVLCVCCYWTEAESDREKHSVFFGTHPTHPVFFGTHPTHSRRGFEHYRCRCNFLVIYL